MLLICCFFLFFFFFKQKTAYEMRISDWSSDVCSSDLGCASSAKSCRARCASCGRSGRPGTPPPVDVAHLATGPDLGLAVEMQQIGRASCRERVCQYV